MLPCDMREKKIMKFFLVLPVACSGGRFEINCPSVSLKILELPEWTEDNFNILKNHEGDLSQKSPDPNIWYLLITPNQ